MDKLTRYPQLIKQTLSEYVEFDHRQPEPGVEILMIADEDRDHYPLFTLGLAQRKWVRNLRVYIRLIEGKIWIEHDLTEESIATESLRRGASEENIVLTFHPPEMRPCAEFATV